MTRKRIILLTMSAALAVSSAQALENGIYRDKAPGYGGDVIVTAIVRGGRIAEITTENTGGEKSEYYLKAEEELTAAIIAAQGIEGVDTVAGATGTSESILIAMRGILQQADYTGSGAGPVSSVKEPTLTAESKPTI